MASEMLGALATVAVECEPEKCRIASEIVAAIAISNTAPATTSSQCPLMPCGRHIGRKTQAGRGRLAPPGFQILENFADALVPLLDIALEALAR